MKVSLLDHTVDPLFVISKAARTCYQSEDKDELSKREGFVKGLIKSGHLSPLEFAEVTWDIGDVSRVLLAQATRHRIASFCVESQRYCDTKENPVIMPVSALKIDSGCLDFVNACKKFYSKLVENGVPKEDARYFLPMGITCNFKMKMNFRELRHFLKLRLDRHAQWEIRELAMEMYYICQEKWPWLVEDIKINS